jgi:hypothetical protein
MSQGGPMGMHQSYVDRVRVDPQQRPKASRVDEGARLRSTAIRTTTFPFCPTLWPFKTRVSIFQNFQEYPFKATPKQ